VGFKPVFGAPSPAGGHDDDLEEQLVCDLSCVVIGLADSRECSGTHLSHLRFTLFRNERQH
jgi:hypothetical protein